MNEEKVENIDLKKIKPGISHFWLKVVTNIFGNDIKIPLMVAKGKKKGPVFGITALVHGDELNGLSVIQKVFDRLDLENLKGTIIASPIINVPGFLARKREFSDGRDLNHKFPGKEKGGESVIYAFNIFQRLIINFDYLLDLHTARFGNVNSYYLRANLKEKKIEELSNLLNAEIILNCEGGKGTLRRQAYENKITAITLELGDPNKFQKEMISDSTQGLMNCLISLGMQPGKIILNKEKPIICNSSKRIHTEIGGILEVLPEQGDVIKKGEKIAIVKNVFGKIIEEYFSPDDGVVIGKNINPVNHAGSRIVHMGKIKN